MTKTGKKRAARYRWNKPDAAEQFEFLHVVPAHRRASVMTQIRDVRTHSSTSNRSITKDDLFELHKSVQTERLLDINKPMGGWKVEPNGCNAVGRDDRPTYIEDAAQAYAKLHMGFFHIHPFWDGNGRLARLIANIPLLKSGLPPLVIDESRRMEYIKSLSTYQIETGQLNRESGVWPGTTGYEQLQSLCQDCYQSTYDLIEQARA